MDTENTCGELWKNNKEALTLLNERGSSIYPSRMQAGETPTVTIHCHILIFQKSNLIWISDSTKLYKTELLNYRIVLSCFLMGLY